MGHNGQLCKPSQIDALNELYKTRIVAKSKYVENQFTLSTTQDSVADAMTVANGHRTEGCVKSAGDRRQVRRAIVDRVNADEALRLVTPFEKGGKSGRDLFMRNDDDRSSRERLEQRFDKNNPRTLVAPVTVTALLRRGRGLDKPGSTIYR